MLLLYQKLGSLTEYLTMKLNLQTMSCTSSRAGGIATYVSSNLVSELIIPHVEPLHFDCIFVKVALHENKCITIGNIYRPPSAPAESFNYMISTINYITCRNEIIILGDFNKNWIAEFSSKEKNIFGNLNLT